MSQTVRELPWPHGDKLAFLMIRLQTVTQSPNAKMNVASPAQVFGPQQLPMLCLIQTQ